MIGSCGLDFFGAGTSRTGWREQIQLLYENSYVRIYGDRYFQNLLRSKFLVGHKNNHHHHHHHIVILQAS